MTTIGRREVDAAVVAGNGNESGVAGRSDLELVRSAYEIEFDRTRPATLDSSALTLLSTLAPSVHLDRSENDPEATTIEPDARSGSSPSATATRRWTASVCDGVVAGRLIDRRTD